MRIVTIPGPARPALKTLVKLEDELFARLLAVLDEVKPELAIPKFQSAISERLPEFGEGPRKEVVSAFFNFCFVRDNLDISAAETGQVIIDSLRNDPLPEHPFSEDELPLLQSRIEAVLLKGKNLEVSAKANAVVTSHNKVYLAARVISDLRPIFDHGADEVCGITTIHSLAIQYHQDGASKSFYVALDDNDLKSLKRAIDRADQKACKLRDLTNKTNVTFLSP